METISYDPYNIAENYSTGGAAQTFGSPAAVANPAAYGTVPAPTPARPTAAQNTGTAIATGQQVNNQLPGYTTSLGNIGQNIASETAGQLPADVIRQIQQQSAERGAATGSPGSDNSNAAYLQALGLTSLNLTGTGQNQFSSILQSLPGANISQNPNFFPSSGLAYEAGANNSNLAAAPNPYAAASAALGAVRGGMGAGGGGVTLPGATNSDGADNAFMNGPTAPDNGPVLFGPQGSLTPTQADDSANILNQIMQQYGSGNAYSNAGGSADFNE